MGEPAPNKERTKDDFKKHVPCGIAVDGNIVAGIICIRVLGGDFHREDINRHFAVLQGNLAGPFLGVGERE